MKNYDDIINYKYVGKHKMDISNRAAIFSPFAALTGYAEAINEIGRVVDKKIELTEDEKKLINEKLNLLNNNLNKEVLITYFVKDLNKNGGTYFKIKNKIKKIDTISKELIFINIEKIKLTDILDIEIL